MNNQNRNSHTAEMSSSPWRTQEHIRSFERFYHSSGDYSPSPRASSVQQLSDLQTLESSFRRLGVSDSTTRQHQPPLLDTRRSNQVYGQTMISSRNNLLFPSNSQQLWFQKENLGNVYDAYKPYDYDFQGRSVMGGGDIPFSPRNPYIQRPWAYSNGGDSVYNVDPYIRNNSRSKDRIDFHGLQEVIAEASGGEGIDRVLDNVLSSVCELMLDPIGHHIFQKLLEKCSDDQITRVLDMVIQQPVQFVRVCADSYGTRAIQDLMRYLRTEEHISQFMLTLGNIALLLTKTPNAHHVILFSFNLFTPSQSKCLLEVIVQHCYQIAIDQHGCCMLQQCIGKTSGELRDCLIREIINNALNLCVNCYGNYVVQYVLELENRQVVAALSRQLDGHYVHLSRDKYGSHAVQKCLKNREFSSRKIILTELLHDIDSLLVDPFGNYVIQTAWMVSQDDVRNELMYYINRNAQLMRCNRYGRKVLEKLNLWS